MLLSVAVLSPVMASVFIDRSIDRPLNVALLLKGTKVKFRPLLLSVSSPSPTAVVILVVVTMIQLHGEF